MGGGEGERERKGGNKKSVNKRYLKKVRKYNSFKVGRKRFITKI